MEQNERNDAFRSLIHMKMAFLVFKKKQTKLLVFLHTLDMILTLLLPLNQHDS